MKQLILTLFFALTSFNSVETKVYICGSAGAKKYHYKENCRGLNACKHQVIKTTLKEAEGYGLSLCGWED